MKSHGIHIGSLFIILSLLFPLSGLAYESQNLQRYRPSATICISAGESPDTPSRDHYLCESGDDDLTEVAGSCACQIYLKSFCNTAVPVLTRLECADSDKKLPNTYTSIFVPPQ